MVQLGDLLSGSLETIKRDHKKAEEKIKNDLKEFTEKAKRDQDKLSSDFSFQLNRYATDSEREFVEKIKPLELKLDKYDRSFRDYSSRIEELKSIIGQELQNKKNDNDA